MFCIQVITSVSPPKDLWFLNIFEGCLVGKVVFYVIMSVLRQKPIMLWLLLPPAFPVCHVLVPGVPGWASGWHFRVCLSPWGRCKCAEFAAGSAALGRGCWELPWSVENVWGAELDSSSTSPGLCWCSAKTCAAPKNQCDSKWRDLGKALALSCLIYSWAMRVCVSTM